MQATSDISAGDFPTDPVGRLLFNVLTMIAKIEADLIRMRTSEGMKVVKARAGYAASNPRSNPPKKATSSSCSARGPDLRRAG